ncbi:unnamed protein product [Arabidopsis thaliana]|uniref:(thale cress) hypothetical protein n=1 Tax=Arabidopsis thaliana TaxID=3702 RepID=A0A7G2F2Y3_ARATH|nr:unnamed protein product [Arabidopsis thaliana]
MGVEVVNSGGFEVAPAPFEGKPEKNGKLDQGKGDDAPINFGSVGELPKNAEENNNKVVNSDAPKNAAEEWPVAKQIHSFYLVKYRSYADPKIKAKLDLADKELEKLNKARTGVLDKLRAKRAERSELFDLLDPLKSERKGFNTMFDEKRKEMEPLQQALGKLRSNDGGSARGPAICSSEEELNSMIYSYQYRIQHESIPLTEEKQILKEIRLLEGTRDKVIANAAMRAKIKESMGQKDDIQGQVKLMGAGLDGVKKERQAISARINELSEKLKATKDEITVLENELKTVSEKRDKAYSNIHDLRRQRDETNSEYYQNRTVLNKARDLAAQKNISELEALANAEVEKFISLWCSKKNFREDYEKRILQSLDSRQLSRDGRMRNPDEKPLIAPEAAPSKATPSETEVVPKAKAKPQPKEEPVSAPKPDATVAQNTEKAKDAVKEQEKKAKKKTGGNTETETEEVPEASEEEIEAPVQEEKPQKEKVFKEKPIRNRTRGRGPETIPRAILKRKKSTNYWVYAAPAALVVLLLLVLGYYYVL